MVERNPQIVFLTAQAVFVAVLIGYQHLTMEQAKKSLFAIARYIAYLLALRGLQEAYSLLPLLLRSRLPDLKASLLEHRQAVLLFALASGVLVLQNESLSFDEFTSLLFAAWITQRYMKVQTKQTINYGVGMACSFFEGYLKLIIPSDGSPAGTGFEAKMRAYEATQGVVFPVRKLLLVVPKSLFCPPDLNHYNNTNRPDLPYIEAMANLDDLELDVAGVRNRVYRNSTYKIYRPNKRPVCLCVEFATPLRTLHKVLQNRDLYDELCDVDQAELTRDFCRQLEHIIEKSRDTRGKCELVHFDDGAEDANLADVLLAKIGEMVPDFEDILARHAAEHPDE